MSPAHLGHADVALSTALRVAADLHGSSGAATPDKLRELAEDAERLERAAAAPFPLPELAEVLRDARRYRRSWEGLNESHEGLGVFQRASVAPYAEPVLYSVLPYVDEYYPGAEDYDPERPEPIGLWAGTVAVEVRWAPGARALYGVYPPDVRARVNDVRRDLRDTFDPLPSWELWQD